MLNNSSALLVRLLAGNPFVTAVMSLWIKIPSSRDIAQSRIIYSGIFVELCAASCISALLDSRRTRLSGRVWIMQRELLEVGKLQGRVEGNTEKGLRGAGDFERAKKVPRRSRTGRIIVSKRTVNSRYIGSLHVSVFRYKRVETRHTESGKNDVAHARATRGATPSQNKISKLRGSVYGTQKNKADTRVIRDS